MHQPIKDNLEEYLRGAGKGPSPREFDAHLASCPSCTQELRLLETQALSLRSLQAPPAEDAAEPRADFYARVMDRIEQQTQRSIWSVLLQPSFGRRLAMASGALALVLGTYLVSTEPGDLNVADHQGVVISHQDPTTDRDAVLVNLVSYHE